MRYLLMMSMLLWAAPNLPADERDMEVKRPGEKAAQSQSGTQTPGRKKSSAPAKRFTPSEKIGADSAVSFPVDI